MNGTGRCGGLDAGGDRIRCDEGMSAAAAMRPKPLLSNRREFMGAAAAFAVAPQCLAQKEAETAPVVKWKPFPGSRGTVGDVSRACGREVPVAQGASGPL